MSTLRTLIRPEYREWGQHIEPGNSPCLEKFCTDGSSDVTIAVCLTVALAMERDQFTIRVLYG
ncbi:MAG: hypothetical protein AAGA75_25720 [Cyanobacteria bacterium P01_E01_bin.6]